MAPSIVHLPNGQTLTVTPIFGGIGFKSNHLETKHNVFPPGWTIILHSEDGEADHEVAADPPSHTSTAAHTLRITNPLTTDALSKDRHIHRYRKPTLCHDHLFISSISNPSSEDFKPATSQTRLIAMMLWATLWWYFHQPEPEPYLRTPASALTPDAGKPRGEWRVNINREGIFKGKHLLPKLERMGLIASKDSSVGIDPEDGVGNAGEGWKNMFISRKSFWQLDARIYLFTLSPTQGNSPYPSISPGSSRPASPSRSAQNLSMARAGEESGGGGLFGSAPSSLLNRHTSPPGPFTSSSHLPTFYPPPPLQYTFTNSVRHPVRPKPHRQGETFYTRYVPSLGQYISFRVACLGKSPVVHRGPTISAPATDVRFARQHPQDAHMPSIAGLALDDGTGDKSDVELLHKWMNDERVSASWGESGPIEHQQKFLETALTSRHSFPVIGCFDGKPFGYFEIYWTKEDKLSAYLGRECRDWDRGLHILVGEQEFRGPHRVRVWLSALVHYCWLADLRTENVFMEPRVDNEKALNYALEVGFHKAGEVSFPHKQSNLLQIRRETFDAPAL